MDHSLIRSEIAGALPADAPSAPAFLRFVNAVIGQRSTTFTLDDVSISTDFATATVFRLAGAGGRVIHSDDVSVATDLEPGGRYEVLASGGAGSPWELIVVRLPDDRAPDGEAAVRVLNGIRDLRAVHVMLAGVAIDLQRYAGSSYSPVPAGRTRTRIGTGSSNIFLESDLQLDADTTYTLLLTGGGEVPPRATLIVDGTQVHSPPPPGTPIETGDLLRPVISRRALLAATASAVAAACAGCADFSQRRPVQPAETPSAQSPPPMPGPNGDSSDAQPPSLPGDPVAPAEFTPERIEIPAIGLSAAIVAVSASDLSILHTSRNGLPILHKSTAGIVSELTTAQSSTLVGHNTPRPNAPAVFERLSQVPVGGDVTIAGGGQSHRILVTESFEAPKGELPDVLWSPVPTGLRRLVLITCSGGRNSEGLRTHNWVVVAYA